MSKLSNIDLAYEYLKNKNDSAQFKEIWNFIETKSTQEHADKTALMASLYSALVCDNRFSLTADGLWALRNNLKFENIKKQYDNLDKSQNNRKYAFADSEDEEDAITTQYDEELEEEDHEEYEEDEADFGDGDVVIEN